MSKSKITFRKSSTEFYSIYVYNSITPEDTGYLLAHYYNEPDLILDLIMFGDVYKLEKFIFPNENDIHHIKSPKKNITLFCVRDLGGKWNENSFKYKKLLEIENFKDVYFNYYWEYGEWMCLESPDLDLYQPKSNIKSDFIELNSYPLIKKA